MWGRLDDGWHSHPKVVSVSPGARGLDASAISWCGQHLTDGKIRSAQLPAVMPGPRRDELVAFAEELVDVGLFERNGDGYLVHDFHDYNPTREKVLKDRGAARDRMSRVRANKPRTSGEVRPPRPVPSRPEESDAFRREGGLGGEWDADLLLDRVKALGLDEGALRALLRLPAHRATALCLDAMEQLPDNPSAWVVKTVQGMLEEDPDSLDP